MQNFSVLKINIRQRAYSKSARSKGSSQSGSLDEGGTGGPVGGDGGSCAWTEPAPPAAATTTRSSRTVFIQYVPVARLQSRRLEQRPTGTACTRTTHTRTTSRSSSAAEKCASAADIYSSIESLEMDLQIYTCTVLVPPYRRDFLYV